MNNLFFQNTDSIPFILKKDFVASVDSISANDFLSYEYLSLDSTNLLYNISLINHEKTFLSIAGLARPFIQQFGSILFLVFTILFVLSALVFKNSGLAYFGNIRPIFNIDIGKTKYDKKLLTTFDFWGTLFYIFQTFILFSIIFTNVAAQKTNLYYSSYDYLILFSQIFVSVCLFVLVKYLFYRFIGSVFNKSNMKETIINTYLSTIYLAGIIFFIPAVVYIYIPEAQLYVLYFLLMIFLAGRFAVFIQSYVFFKKAHIGSFYFFVYLCGIEIMPYLLLYKAIVLIN